MKLGPLTIVNSRRAQRNLPLSMEQWAEQLNYAGHRYPLFGYGPTYPNEKLEEVAHNFRGYVSGGFMGNVVVFSCILARLQVFSQARFQYRELRNGRPGDYFGTKALEILERPEPNRTTSDLLSRMEVDASLGGNWYGVKDGNRLRRLRPDWTAIALSGDEADPDAEVVGYVHFPGGPHSGKDPIAYLPDEVAHYAPIPDPLAKYRGMSWITPVVREVMADKGFVEHKIKFLEKGGARNFLHQVDKSAMTGDQFKDFVGDYRRLYESAAGAHMDIWLRAAVDSTPLGSHFSEMDLKKVQGAGETRIAAAAGVPPIVVGLSEGLESATYSNYGQARRRFVDGTVRWLWQNAAASLENLVGTPNDASQLWYDDRDIPALQEDILERAQVQEKQALSMRQLVDGGFDPDSVVDAIVSGDLKRLTHAGLLSVQLQEPGAQTQNGNGSVPGAVVPNT